MHTYQSAADLAQAASPSIPVICARPHAAKSAATWFLRHFPGDSYYAVKANPSLWLLDALFEAGIQKFECASIAEVRLIANRFPDAEIAFMHPVKPIEAIAEAYTNHRVRSFSLDCADELDKILTATNQADDLTLILRHKVKGQSAKLSLASKFGAAGDDAVNLLQRMRQVTDRLGVAFHVGSQCMSPSDYVAAIDTVEKTIVRAGVIVDILDIGGGFPSVYPGMTPPPLIDYMRAINDRFEQSLVAENCALWCEPGRAFSAEASSLLVRVESRRDDELYINDGVYGSLYDAGHLNWPFPVRLALAPSGPVAVKAYRFYGPTCDDIDVMAGPFYLPADIDRGQHIEIGMLGAYGVAMRTDFNGFAAHDQVFVNDPPISTMFAETHGVRVANENYANESEAANV